MASTTSVSGLCHVRGGASLTLTSPASSTASGLSSRHIGVASSSTAASLYMRIGDNFVPVASPAALATPAQERSGGGARLRLPMHWLTPQPPLGSMPIVISPMSISSRSTVAGYVASSIASPYMTDPIWSQFQPYSPPAASPLALARFQDGEVYGLQLPMTVPNILQSMRLGAKAVLPSNARMAAKTKEAAAVAAGQPSEYDVYPMVPALLMMEDLPHHWTVTDMWPKVHNPLAKVDVFCARVAVWKRHPDTGSWAAFNYDPISSNPFSNEVFVKAYLQHEQSQPNAQACTGGSCDTNV
jgi:hypothetical protein